MAPCPVENSAAGSINKAYDLLLDHDLHVHGEILLRVRHNLLTTPGQAAEIREVRSHFQALAQCEDFLNRSGYTAVPWYDTAGSAKDLAQNPARALPSSPANWLRRLRARNCSRGHRRPAPQLHEILRVGKGEAERSAPQQDITRLRRTQHARDPIPAVSANLQNGA